MSYQRSKMELAHKVQTMISNHRPGEIISLSDLEIKFGLQYGFGRLTIVRALKPYEMKGAITIKGDTVEVLQQ